MRILMLPLVLALSACSLTPPLVKPQAPVPTVFPDAAAPEVATGHAADLGWRAMFGDPRLQHLIALALEHNRDLRLAALNVEAVQALFRIQRAARLPGVGVEASATRERTVATTVGGTSSPSAVQEQLSVGLGLSAFEIDLFGRVRALSDAAFARYLASEQGHRATQIALVGAVADAYFAERLAQEQRQLAEHTLADWRQSMALAHLLRQADQSSGLDVAQAEGQVATAEADLEARQRAQARARNALALLVGTELPTELPAPLALDAQPLLTRLPAGLPSDLLARRPDILQAEQNLVAANANVGATRALYYPSVSITGLLGSVSTAFSSLFTGPASAGLIAAGVSGPIFTFGGIEGPVSSAEAQNRQALLLYQQTILNAFRETNDALTGSQKKIEEVALQGKRVDALREFARLSKLRFDKGVAAYLDVLVAENELFAAELAGVRLLADRYTQLVNVYQAMGGGWVDIAASTTPTPQSTITAEAQ